MENVKYERPKFEFHELRLLERVADVCWGLGHAYLDVDKSGTVTPGDLQIDIGSGCHGDSTAQKINEWFVKNGYQNPNYNGSVSNTKENGLVAGVS